MPDFQDELDYSQFGSNGRAVMPHQKRREIDRAKAEVDGAGELYVKMLSAINKGTQYKLNGIALIDAIAEHTARLGPIHAAHVPEVVGSYSVLMRIADSCFGNNLQG